MPDLAVTVLVALVVGWVLGMMTAACLDARRAVKADRATYLERRAFAEEYLIRKGAAQNDRGSDDA